MPKLGVNIDHVATLRQLRRSTFPDIVLAARMSESAGADSIVVHLREDRRHIQDADVFSLRREVRTKLNLEMSIAPEIVKIACRIKPDQATLVPEKRRELTTEGGLDAAGMPKKVKGVVQQLVKCGIRVSLFIEPQKRHILAAKDCGAEAVEFHTGGYANSASAVERKASLARIKEAAIFAHGAGLIVNAGHGLDYDNVCPIAGMPYIHELNIGYAIVCYSVFVGLKNAVRMMKGLAASGHD